MKLSINIGTNTIEFDVIYRKRKSMEIRVEPQGIITVIAPNGTKQNVILGMVSKKANWILEKLNMFNKIEYKNIEKNYVDNESFLFLGEEYLLAIVEDKLIKRDEIKIYDGKLWIRTSNVEKEFLKASLEGWYRKQAAEKIKNRIDYYQKFFSKKPLKIVVKEQKKRWGSCTSKGTLLFNWRDIMAREDVLDYIIVHEMCHLIHMDHSKNFYNMVASIMPDYKLKQEWLKDNGFKMKI